MLVEVHSFACIEKLLPYAFENSFKKDSKNFMAAISTLGYQKSAEFDLAKRALHKISLMNLTGKQTIGDVFIL